MMERSEAVEDYLEAIYLLSKKKGRAKVRDLSYLLKVKAPTVTEMIQKLAKRGLVVYERYRGVTLTKEGENIAKEVLNKHEILKGFLMMLGVDERIADKDACRIEHCVHPETIKRLSAFLEFILSNRELARWFKYFKR